MLLRVVIVDDSPEYANILNIKLAQWAKHTGHTVMTDIYTNPTEFIATFAEKSIWNALLLDISMPEMNGLELAAKIREQDSIIPIIFISDYLEYCMQGYEVSAMRYLHKDAPNFDDRLDECLKAVMRTIRIRTDEKLVVSGKNGIIRVAYTDIIYIVSGNHSVVFHTKDINYTERITIRQVCEKLPEYFVAASRSAIVNVKHIDAIIANDVLMTNNDRIKVARSCKKAICDAVNNLM